MIERERERDGGIRRDGRWDMLKLEGKRRGQEWRICKLT